MKRGLATSGGKQHIMLVKLATKRIVDSFDNLRILRISYEQREMSFEIRIKEEAYGYTHAFLEYRPDIVVMAENEQKEREFGKPQWSSILDSRAIIFEAETDPSNFFGNKLKTESYKKIKANDIGRGNYAFVLVCWDDVTLPNSIEPFDEVWKFPRRQADLRR